MYSQYHNCPKHGEEKCLLRFQRGEDYHDHFCTQEKPTEWWRDKIRVVNA